jgi:hypothetical protein
VFRLEERMLEAIRRVTEVDQHAMDNARQRLAALSEEAQRVDDVIIERAHAFQEQLERRNAEAASARRLRSISSGTAGRVRQQVTERQQEHLAHVAGLAERGDALAQRLGELGAELDRCRRRAARRRTASPNPPPG